jgi:Response regulator containing a CheY-like receiver domain and an HTH DNA-binding domain
MTARGRSDAVNLALGQLHGEPLTARELQVVAAVVAGHTTARCLSATLLITRKTVQTHLYHIYAKTGAANLTDLALMAAGLKVCPVSIDAVME